MEVWNADLRSIRNPDRNIGEMRFRRKSQVILTQKRKGTEIVSSRFRDFLSGVP